MSVLLISPKTVQQWPQCWHQAAVTNMDINFCPKPTLKWFSLTQLWRSAGEGSFSAVCSDRIKGNGCKLKEGRGFRLDVRKELFTVGMVRSCYRASTRTLTLLCGDTCMCHLTGWNRRHTLNIGNILKTEHRQVGTLGTLCLLFNRPLIWPVLICISSFICSHHFVNLHFTLWNHGLILPGTPKQHPRAHFPQPHSLVVPSGLLQLD